LPEMAWVNGVLGNIGEAKISIEDRGYLFGDGVYEVIRIYNQTPFYLSAHLERLANSAAAIRIKLPCGLDRIEEIINDLIERSALKEAYIYIQLTRGSAKRDHLFPENVDPGMVIYIRAMEPTVPSGDIKPESCIILPDERWMNCHIKTINLLPNLLARQQAAEAGAIEAILYRPGGLVTEGSRSNLFAVIGEKVMTHPQTNLILPGITRKIVLDILNSSNIPFAEEAFTKQELQEASEVWITSTTMEVMPIESVDGKKLGPPVPGPLCLQVMKAFRARLLQVCYGGAELSAG
jgi:D-alanine transaminase